MGAAGEGAGVMGDEVARVAMVRLNRAHDVAVDAGYDVGDGHADRRYTSWCELVFTFWSIAHEAAWVLGKAS